MKQDGDKEVEVESKIIGDRKIFFIDVGDMPPKDALRVINEIRKRQGQAPVSSNFGTWVFAAAAAGILALYLLTIFNVV